MKRSKKTIHSLILAVMLFSMLPAGMAFAQPADADVVDTSATIDPAGTPPDVLYKWELPDMQSDVAGIQYGTVGNPHQHDDDMTLAGMQVTPNLEDLPEMRLIEYWWVVTDPNGIDDIIDAFVRVYHPAGDLKYQLHGELVPCTDPRIASFASTGSALEAGIHTDQLSSTDAATIIEECGKNVLQVYRVVGDLSKHQPCGVYRVEAQAVDQAGNVDPTPINNNFEVFCVIGFEKDFTEVNFGQILPNTTKWVRGDYDMTTPLRPSVKNTGNTLLYLSLEYTEMLGINFQKVIDVFDAQLNTQAYDPIPADTTVCFNNEGLGSNEVGQLDLSIHPGSVPADTYTGDLFLWGRTSCAP